MAKSKVKSSFLTQFDKKDIEIETCESVYDGYFKLLKFHFRHRCFAGGWSPVISRELFERGHAVAVLPYDPKRDQIILIEQIRVGAMAADLSPWQFEIVAGMIENNEAPESVAVRETKEEAGLNIEKLVPISRYLSSSGACSETIQLYLGIVDANLGEGIHGLIEENEDILVHRVSRETAMQWLKEGKIENAASIIALQWLGLNLESVKASYTPNT